VHFILYDCETWSLTFREECTLRAFENKVLRRIFGPKRDEVTREWRRLHNKELYALYSSPNLIGEMKSRIPRWARHVESIWERRGFWLENLREGDDLEDRGIDGRIILKWILEKREGMGIDWIDHA
jgi:hypothetical protein